MEFLVVGLILKLDMLTLKPTSGIVSIHLYLEETMVSLKVVLSKNAQKWPFLLIFS